jgi:hypothetical protein
MLLRPRAALIGCVAILMGACSGGASGGTPPAPPPTPAPVVSGPATTAQVDDLEHRSFQYFWDSANPVNGLVPDRYPTPTFSSVAAVGFALTAYTVGVERGWVARADAAARTLTTLNFLIGLPQGDAATGTAGFHGYFYHFLDMTTGLRYQTNELSSIDTALLMAGVLNAEQYYGGSDATETQIRSVADALYRRVEWDFLADGQGLIAMGWKPDVGQYPQRWVGYNEAMLLYVLAIGSPTHPVPGSAWAGWTAGYDATWGTAYGQTYLGFPPLFGHQYSHVWIDFNGIQDAYMKAKSSDYFKNSRAATYAQQAYAKQNALGYVGYDDHVFGVTACDGPGAFTLTLGGVTRKFYGYAGRGMGGVSTYDDGTLAPTGVVSSIAFAPEIVLPAIGTLIARYGDFLYGTYGFLDAFNPTVPDGTAVQSGRVVPGKGWVDVDYLGIDEGPIVAMIENYRSGLVWTQMRANPYIKAGLKGAGFTGGWVDAP